MQTRPRDSVTLVSPWLVASRRDQIYVDLYTFYGIFHL
jgi:hypothetical protein